MPGTTSIGRISGKQSKSPMVAPIALSINPRGERSLGQTVKSAPRLGFKATRDYGKEGAQEKTPFNLPGYGG